MQNVCAKCDFVFAVGNVEHRLRKYRNGCNRLIPLWVQDIKEHKTEHLKLPSVCKLHIFRWLLPYCKNWSEHLKDHDFTLYLPKLKELEDRNLKCMKIEPVVPNFRISVLPDKVIDVLCDVYKKVVFVTCVQPYIYEEKLAEFPTDFVHQIVGSIRVVTPEEELCEASVSVCMQIDRFFWHLHACLTPLAWDSSFFTDQCTMHDDAHKTTVGGKTLQLFGKMSQLSQQWNNNMRSVLSVLKAQIAIKGVSVFAEEEGTPVQGLDNELETAMQKACDDKPVLQEAMKGLHMECCAARVSFAKSNVAWVKIAVNLPNRGKNRRPLVHKIRRPYPNM